MKAMAKPFFTAVLLILTTGCAITHVYGPYMGRVVDRETKEPLPGTVIFVRFYTVGIELMQHYVDAVETVSDSNGEFHIPRQRLFTTPIPFEHWDERGSFIIFKPGYEVQFYVPENKYTVIALRRLKTRKERIENLHGITFTDNIPYDKWPILFKYRNIESISVGLTPYDNPHN